MRVVAAGRGDVSVPLVGLLRAVIPRLNFFDFPRVLKQGSYCPLMWDKRFISSTTF